MRRLPHRRIPQREERIRRTAVALALGLVLLRAGQPPMARAWAPAWVKGRMMAMNFW